MRTRFAMTCSLAAAAASIGLTGVAQAALYISEVHAGGSSNSAYSADWFELTNTDAAPLDITGWKMDDGSNAFASAVALRSVTSIGPGQSVIFAEGNTSGSNDVTIAGNFKTYWFGGSIPAGFTMGGYGGSNVGLSTSAGDGVSIFNAGGTLIARVDFGPISDATKTLDNSAYLDNATISTASAVGVNNAFTSNGTSPVTETGSPGVVPEPASLALLAIAGLAIRRRR